MANPSSRYIEAASILGSRGGETRKERTVTRGEPLPPTPQSGQTCKLVDPTKNGSGRPWRAKKGGKAASSATVTGLRNTQAC